MLGMPHREWGTHCMHGLFHQQVPTPSLDLSLQVDQSSSFLLSRNSVLREMPPGDKEIRCHSQQEFRSIPPLALWLRPQREALNSLPTLLKGGWLCPTTWSNNLMGITSEEKKKRKEKAQNIGRLLGNSIAFQKRKVPGSCQAPSTPRPFPDI